MGMTRREMLKASAVAGGVVWAAPFLSTGTAAAWAGRKGCTCDGAIVYAKFAPGNAQTCQNQCLQPGPEVTRLDFDCLVQNGLLTVCDNVQSGASFASLGFSRSVTPIKLAMKTTNDCYVARCNDGFHKVYHWVSSTNAEPFDETPCDSGGGIPKHHDGCLFADPATSSAEAMFQTFWNGPPSGGPCTGSQGGNIPGGTRCGSSYSGDSGCTEQITGVVFDTNTLGQPLNFIEMELCVTNLSRIPCAPVDCSKNP